MEIAVEMIFGNRPPIWYFSFKTIFVILRDMTNWRLKRQLSIVGTILFIAAMVSAWFLFRAYFTPTCFDNRKNGGEADVDCGGSCISCEVKHAKPVAIFWARGVAVRENLYDAVAYAENPNEVVSSSRVEYEFILSDGKGEIARRSGTGYLFPQERIYFVEVGIETSRAPTRVDFRVIRAEWVRQSQTRADLVIEKREYSVRNRNGTRQSVIAASTFNREPFDFKEAELVFVVFDKVGTVIGINKITLEGISSRERKETISVWPQEFSGDIGNIFVSARVNLFDPLVTKTPQ